MIELLPLLEPNLQIDFYYKLRSYKSKFFYQALQNTIKNIEIRKIDSELSELVNPKLLNKVACFSIRGEVFFPVPCLLKENPSLLGYYRLIFGISQKEMYTKTPGYSKFKKLEEKSSIINLSEEDILVLCKSLIRTSEILVESFDDISINTVSELQLMTIGAQFRGGRNNDIGSAATITTFQLIKKIVQCYVEKIDDDDSNHQMSILNNSNRIIDIKFAADPDIVIIEKFEEGREYPVVAIEIKGGGDSSNIHNRIGEAEKSHQKAKGKGFTDFWTIIRVDMSYEDLKRESPTTTNFFNLDKILDENDKEHQEFSQRLRSAINI